MSVVNMIEIVFYSLLLVKVWKCNFFLYEILWVHYCRTTRKCFSTKGRAGSGFLLLSPSLSLRARKSTLLLGWCPALLSMGGTVTGSSKQRWWEKHPSIAPSLP